MIEQQKFIEKFNLPKDGFEAPTPFAGACGFKTLKNFKDDYVSSIVIYIEDTKDIVGKFIPLNVYIDFGKISPNGKIIFYSKDEEFLKTIKKPIGLFSKDDYFYKDGLFYKGKNNIPYSGFDILKEVYDEHLKPTKKIKGLWLRIKLILFRILLAFLFKGFSYILIIILRFISGESYKMNPFERHLNEILTSASDIKKNLKAEIKKSEKEIDFFGYKTDVPTIFSYCLLHLMLFFLYYSVNHFNLLPWLIKDVIKKIFENNFLIILYALITLIWYDRNLPDIVFAIIKWSDVQYLNFFMKPIKI